LSKSKIIYRIGPVSQTASVPPNHPI